MATAAQTEANRQNAQHSTGPRTEEGKAESRLNAVKHGLLAKIPVLRDENREEWIQFVFRFVEDLAPEGEVQSSYAEDAALAAWRLRRIPLLEARIVGLGMSRKGFELFTAEKGGPAPNRRQPAVDGQPQEPFELWEDAAILWQTKQFAESTGLINIPRYEKHLHDLKNSNIAQLRLLKKEQAALEHEARQRPTPPTPPAAIPEATMDPAVFRKKVEDFKGKSCFDGDGGGINFTTFAQYIHERAKEKGKVLTNREVEDLSVQLAVYVKKNGCFPHNAIL